MGPLCIRAGDRLRVTLEYGPLNLKFGFKRIDRLVEHGIVLQLKGFASILQKLCQLIERSFGLVVTRSSCGLHDIVLWDAEKSKSP